MASRHREITDPRTDRENLHGKLARVPAQKILTRRPALDEVGNKLNRARDDTKKQPEQIKDVKKKVFAKENVPVKNNEKLPKSYSSQQIATIVDPDANNKDDLQLVTEYVNDIYEYLRELEVKYAIRPRFLEGHHSTPKMRAILVNWIVQVHLNFKLCLETLFLCISIIDRYLQNNTNVGRENLQLVGASAMMVACKYEESYTPDIMDYVYICDDSFTKKQILKMEMSILKQLDFNIGCPLSIHFLRRYSKIAQVQMEQHNLSKYMLELGLLDDSMSHIRPSIQAAAACCLSLSILNDMNCPSKVWTPTLEHYTTYSYVDFKDVVIKFANLLINADNFKNKSIQQKYAATSLSKISTNCKLKGVLVKKLAHLSPKS